MQLLSICARTISRMIVCLLTTTSTFAAGMKEINPPSVPDEANIVTLVGGRLIDGYGGPPVEDSVLVVRGPMIHAVGSRDEVVIPDEAGVVDIRGMSVLPGLIDSHFHSRNNLRTPVQYELKHGITSFRDPGHPFRFYDAAVRSNKQLPRIFLSGAHLDAHPPAFPDQAIVIRNANHARRTVEEHVDRGASAIKIYSRLPLEHIQAACEAAQDRGVLVTAHLELVDADDAIRAGVRGIEHVTSFGTALAEPREAEQFKSSVYADSKSWRKLRHRLWANLDLDSSPRVKPLLDQILTSGVFVSPTLALFERRAGKKNSTSTEVKGFANMLRFVGLCHEAGAKVVVGSHTDPPFAKTGRGYQRELELLVEAGLTPLEAISAGTLHNAQFLGIENRLGTLEAGKIADLILVEGDPSSDLAAMRNVHHVMLNGIWIGRLP